MKKGGKILKESENYLDSIVLGLNDGLIELTGALAGFTLALQNSKIIAGAGLITGIAASLSMACSEYLSKKAENRQIKIKNNIPFTAAAYTGIAYLLVVLLLIFPFFILTHVFSALTFSIVNAIIIILIFTYKTSKKKEFKIRFFEMVILSLGVALISFGIGYLVRNFIGIEI
jgi:VIT1/CCC1 family predicted Fe2+/Mn2+ transporter